MKKFFTLASLFAFLAVGVSLTGCEENTEITTEEPVMEEPMPEPAPMPEPMPLPADSMDMEMDTDTTVAPAM